MIFEEIYTQLTGESTITALVGSRVYFDHLPTNYDLSNDAIVFEGYVAQAQHTISLENFGDTYTLSVKAISKTPLNTYTIGQAVKDFLKTYSSTNIKAIWFERDVALFNDEDNVYVLNLDFTVDYCNG
jgi:hypothetical protein